MRQAEGGSRLRADGEGDWRVLAAVAPYIWPKGEPEARLRVAVAMVFLILAKVATIWTPFLFKGVVDALTPAGVSDGARALMVAPTALILFYAVMRFMQTGLAQVRDGVFAKVGQRALRRLALQSFAHLHDLSLRFHLQRKTGALSRIIDRGVKGVDFLLRFLVFNLAPLVVELIVVAAIFWLKFDFWYFLVVAATLISYVWYTYKATEWRLGIRKRMNDKDQEAMQKAVDSLLNYETVKYFAAERREVERYDQSMQGYEQAGVETQTSLAWLNAGQAFIISAGLGAAMILAGYGVAQGSLTVGDFVLVNAFMLQITMPLGFLGTVYREIRQAMIDMTELFVLMDQNVEIRDAPDAGPLKLTEGRVTFDSVRFRYDPDREILKGVSFEIPGGRTLAVVGPTGSGKSTLARLLYRFYDVEAGGVRIDGQDLRDVTQESLRQSVGVVPQDTVLFNDTIHYNIAYGRPGASREEVVGAAKAARLDEFIRTLPRGYETEVGERGLKLSGGEKQRVSIARAILKNPPILILDEATSALDTRTEKAIQESLRSLSENRTVLVVAHRLSTVVDADEIIVLDAGEIVERGPHARLLAENGRYAAMWTSQKAAAAPPAGSGSSEEIERAPSIL
ncbi:ABC transporter ATP-binding protein/permease [Neomegalonema sp.]|uniref:ABCB family ABC transporter ATP-binding protein/permease n=1 Tax=Neomegalonema sp. TaxID=2039713 RepID=UPI002614AB5E|nr:ABC transporter ATP-binding protein/permease [Neomegalonema sp.]MDD2867089.1 ABC transporter ATP-binding protein/permease [Neomegalonema sp.]